MNKSYGEKITRQVASLARLELTDAEVRVFTEQVSGVLGYIDQLQEADVSGVEPMIHPLELGTSLREDRVVPSPVDAEGRPRVLESAPDVLDGSFKVPPVL